MAAVWMRARAELRQRWRATVGLALVIGLAGGFVLAAAAGARRTDTAYDRFRAEHAAPDVFLPNPSFGPDFGAIVLDPEEVEAMPQVAQMSVGRTAFSQWGPGFAAADARFGFELPRWKIVEGRAYDPARVDEAMVVRAYAEREGLTVGQRISYPGNPPAGEDEIPPQCERIGEGPQIDVTIVGIAVAPGQFLAPVSSDPWTLLLTPAMHDKLPELIEATGCEFLAFPPTPGMMWVRTHPGQTDEFIDALERRAGEAFVITEPQSSYEERNAESIGLQATALWVLAIAAALAAILVLSQTIARQIALESDDNGPLSALGFTRPQVIGSALVRVLVASGAGALIAIALAIAMSPLAPLGIARLAEPSPGVSIDVVAIGVGALSIVVLIMLFALPPAWMGARGGRRGGRARPSVAATVASRMGLSPPVVAGLRMGLEPGSGRTAVPVRTTVAGVALGLGMLAATLTFGASTSHLLATPTAYGLTFDVWINNDPESFPFEERIGAVREHPEVATAALGTPGGAGQIDGRTVEVMPFEPVKGPVQPRVFDGTYPSAPDEIMLGSRTADRLGKGIGDTVRVTAGEEQSADQTFRVVAIGEIPPVERAGLGEGAIVTPDAMRTVNPATEAIAGGIFVGLVPGADAEAVIAELKRRLVEPDEEGRRAELQHFGFSAPSDVVDFGRVRNLPAILSGVLGLIAAGTLAHVLVTAVRRRRRDLAILKTLGFYRGQARAAVAWQAVGVVVAGALVGLPAGVVLGRWTWTLVVRGLGLAPEPAVPALAVALIVPATLLLAIAISTLPARAAARTPPALVLRAE